MVVGRLKFGFCDELADAEFDCSDVGEVGVNLEPDLFAASLLLHLPPQVHHPHHLQPTDDQVEGGGEEEVVLRGDFPNTGSSTLRTLWTLFNFKTAGSPTQPVASDPKPSQLS